MYKVILSFPISIFRKVFLNVSRLAFLGEWKHQHLIWLQLSTHHTLIFDTTINIVLNPLLQTWIFILIMMTWIEIFDFYAENGVINYNQKECLYQLTSNFSYTPDTDWHRMFLFKLENVVLFHFSSFWVRLLRYSILQ